MILLMALRNITRNKKNSIIIMLLIGVITFLFFTGNTVIGQSERRLKNSFVENFTADIVIEKKGEVSMGLFGANVPVIDDYFPIRPLPAYNALLETVRQTPGIEKMTNQISTVAYMEISGFGYHNGVFVCGVNASEYFSLFPGITLEKGRFLKDDEYGIMLTSARAEQIEKRANAELKTGSTIRLTSGGNIGFKIREVPLVGVFSYQNPNSILNDLVITDAQTARVLAAIQVASSDVETSAEETALLEQDDIESMFGGDDLFSDSASKSNYDIIGSLKKELKRGDNAPVVKQTGGEWDYILLKMRDGVNIKKTINELNKKITADGAIAVDWRTAAGMTAILVLLLQALYNAGIIIICIAGVIAIINILLIAVFRRTREIGTLRAIGAGDGYIRTLLIFENCLLGLAGGILGVLFGGLVFRLVNAAEFAIHNELLAGLLGGSVLSIDFYPAMACVSIIFSLVLSIISLLFPIEVAVKIDPVVAVREG